MNRRKFLKSASGLLIAAPPRSAGAQLLNLKFGAPVPAPPPSSSIPLSWDDARFATNSAGAYIGSGNPITAPATFNNDDWDGGPTLSGADGNAVIADWAEGTGEVKFTDCRIRWDEGPRLGTAATIHTIFDGCYLAGWGKELDAHCDLIQADGSLGNCTMQNSCFRCYSEEEAKIVGGPNAVGSDAFRWADASSGTITYKDIAVYGGGRGLSIAADAGDVHLSFENVYFISVSGGFAGSGFYKMLIKALNGYSIITEKWVNVCDATIDGGGNIIPGTQHPSPGSGSSVSYQVLG